MRPPHLIDAGFLVALLNRDDSDHEWAVSVWSQLKPPVLTCEAVLAESLHLLRKSPHRGLAIMEFLECGVIKIPFQAAEHAQRLRSLMGRYIDLPMSFADACLVRMSELYEEVRVVTKDTHFRIYRRHQRQVIPVIMPEV